jgi:hypothetical protein
MAPYSTRLQGKHSAPTLTVTGENSPASFVVEQSLNTMPSAKTLAFDSKTNRIFPIAAFDPPPAGTPSLSALLAARWFRVRSQF